MTHQPIAQGPALLDVPTSTGPGTSPDHGRRRTRRRLAVIGVALLVAGAFVAGLAVGWASGGRSGTPAAAPAGTSTGPSAGTAEALTVPDVRGLSLADARRALTSAGLAATAIGTVDVPSSRPAGTVVAQTPAAGTVGATAVTLSLAVPDTSGSTGAVPAGSVYLADLRPAAGSCTAGAAAVDGVDRAHSVLCRLGAAGSAAWQLDGKVRTVTGVAGLVGGTSRAPVQVRVAVDDRSTTTVTVNEGSVSTFSTGAEGASRLTVSYSATDAAGAQLVLGDVRLLGDPAALATLPRR